MRLTWLSPGDQPSGAPATAPSNGVPAQPPAAPAAGGPPPVPYAEFAAQRHELTETKTRFAATQQQLEQHGSKVTQLTQDLASARAEAVLRVALARAGVQSDVVSDFFVQRYGTLPAEGRPAPTDWIGSLKATEAHFFGGPTVVQPAGAPAPSAPVPPAAPPPAPPPAAAPPARGNPDAGPTGASGSPPTQDPPLTIELIELMDGPTYARRRPEIRKFLADQRR